jgi:hypothetical protein
VLLSGAFNDDGSGACVPSTTRVRPPGLCCVTNVGPARCDGGAMAAAALEDFRRLWIFGTAHGMGTRTKAEPEK